MKLNTLFILMFLLLSSTVSAGVVFNGLTPTNNSVIGLGTPFTINVSVSGFNWTDAYLNFSTNNLTRRNMTVVSQLNSTVLALVGSPIHAQHGIFTTLNTSTVNLSINYVLIGGSTTNVSLNGHVLGTITSGTSIRFDGINISFYNNGNNNISYDKFTGGGATLTVSSTNLTFTNNDYDFGQTFTPPVGTYNYSFVVFSNNGTQRNSSGSRFITVTTNSSPAWSFPVAFPTSPATYTTDLSSFNVTWSDAENDLASVVIQHNFGGTFANYSTINVSNRYTYSTHVPAGNWSWQQIGKDANSNVNSTTLFDYFVTPAPSDVHLKLNQVEGNIFAEFLTTANITGTKTNAEGILDLYINGVGVASGSSANTTLPLTVNSTYTVTLTMNESQNYTGSNVTYTITVPPFHDSEILQAGVCPNTDFASAIFFMFIGFFLLAILFINMATMKIPAFNILIGIGLVIYSFTMFGCSSMMGYVVLGIGLLVMGSALTMK